MKIWLLVAIFFPFCAFAGRRGKSDLGAIFILLFSAAIIWGIAFLCKKIAEIFENRLNVYQKKYDFEKEKFKEEIISECCKILGYPLYSMVEVKNYLSRIQMEIKNKYANKYNEDKKILTDDLLNRYNSKIRNVEIREKKLSEKEKNIAQREEIINTKSMKFPPLARCLAKFDEYKLMKISYELENKKRPAISSALKVAKAVRESRQYILKFNAAKNLIDSYEALFPWIVEYREFDIDEIINSSKNEDNSGDPVKKYMTKAEYSNLTPVERNQKALERFLSGKKSNWQIGRMYERYIGYLYEQKGYKVSYYGAVNGLDDMGRDIIARKGYQHLIVQCKYWKKERTIHENVICQLFGTTIRYRFDHSEKDLFGERYDVHAVLITSTDCSEMAKDFAKYLNVEIIENKPYEDYPMIKCNIGNEGEKIYHLPFDQMYDRVIIEPRKGEFYARTCFEAEQKGFRRAFRWHGN